MTNSSSRRLKNETGSSFARRYQTRSCVARSSHNGSSKATTKDLALARISKCKGKSEALSLSGPSITGSSFARRYQTRSCVARSSHNGSSKATTKDLALARISKCKGKSEALSLSGPSITAIAGENETSCTVPHVVDNKNKVTIPVASKLIRKKSLQSCLEKYIIGHIRAEEDICVAHRIKPLGARCQLCSLDIALTPMNFSESLQFNEFPTAAVLYCGHCYHNLCAESVFGIVEPPCITCLDC